MTPAQFRADFPEFASVSDAQIQFWLTVSTAMVDPARWDELTDIGIELLTAHQLAIALRDQKTGAMGGATGAVSGPLSSKTVDKVSSSYNTTGTQYADAAFWNLTSYGIRFLALARMFGAGGYQL